MVKPKKAIKKPEPKKCKKTVYRVTIKEQHRDFSNQIDARNFARKVLQNDAVYFMTATKEEVEGC